MRPDPLRVTTIVVDWNGTIVADTHRAWRATNRALQLVGVESRSPKTLDEFRAQFTLPLELFFTDLGVPSSRLVEVVEQWNAAMQRTPTVLASGAELFLRTAKEAGIPVIVVSGAHSDVIRYDISTLGIAELITRVHGEVHPKRGVLIDYALNGHIAYIGDTQYDVAEGHAAGATTFAVDYGYGTSESLADADLVVNSLADVLDLVCRPS